MATSSASMLPARVNDLTGMQFGRLTVLSFIRRRGPKDIIWQCKCTCGAQSEHVGRDMVKGRSKSCGCLRRETVSARKSYGFCTMASGTTRDTWSYSSYASMMTRCYNTKFAKFHYYGGRGVTVCDRWRFGADGLDGFQCFLADVGPRPDRSLSIDRIDPYGNYEPGNCRWATHQEQALNKRARTR